MKATGIVRRIDDLGRVVIPKEIRRTMRIREGDPLEIFTDAGGEVIFKKYSPIGELSAFATQYAESIVKATELSVAVCDCDHCVATAGLPKKETVDKKLTQDIEQIFSSRRAFIASNEQDATFSMVEGNTRKVVVAVPIIAMGDVVGMVVMLENENAKVPTESDVKLATVAAQFLGKQMEE
ncbi:MAG: AbrB/MazE/SpoVT family DNA-binding domain-containing protein [Clostridia bacterium]|nr:AbrB/MazE/SpoVT family DNA-binding domain-containing protein [Clostridia bacterium]